MKRVLVETVWDNRFSATVFFRDAETDECMRVTTYNPSSRKSIELMNDFVNAEFDELGATMTGQVQK